MTKPRYADAAKVCSDHFLGGKKSDRRTSASYLPSIFKMRDLVNKHSQINAKLPTSFRVSCSSCFQDREEKMMQEMDKLRAAVKALKKAGGQYQAMTQKVKTIRVAEKRINQKLKEIRLLVRKCFPYFGRGAM